jgi:exopolysaccharide biosynthesis WecB/TagA/CpsF family protein
LRRSRKPEHWRQRWRFLEAAARHKDALHREKRKERRKSVSTLPTQPESEAAGNEARETRQQFVARLRLFWEARKLLFAAFVLGALASLGLELLIPSRYGATTQLMPPDGQSSSGMAMLSALAGRAGGLGVVAGDLLGVKNSGALFVGIVESRTVQDRLVEQFELRRVYHAGKMEDARAGLAAHTRIVEDRKSGIIAVTMTDHDPRLAAAMAQAYVDELERLVEQVSTSSARRERVFLEERLRAVKQDLDSAAQTAGVCCPPYRTLTQAEDEEEVSRINEAHADVVWVRLGAPKQDRWMAEHQDRLNAPLLIGVGAAFDFHTGRVAQAPPWMREHGLEWFFRLSREPGRLWRRYLIYGTQFVALVLLESLGLKKFS